MPTSNKRLKQLGEDAFRKQIVKGMNSQGGSAPKLKGALGRTGGANTMSTNQSPSILGGIKGGLTNAG